MSIRRMSVAGSFYPSEPDEVLRYIEHFNQYHPSHPDLPVNIKAIIVPHAGWVYSGYTANIAYSRVNIQQTQRYIVIGPSHRVGFDGISIADLDHYETPLGNLDIDVDMVGEFKKRFLLEYYPQAHHEHSTEVQMPFIRHYSPNTKVIELVYSNAQPESIVPILEFSLSLENTVVVISTDLSHFHTLKDANEIDSHCLQAIKDKDSNILHNGCEACGIIGVDAILSTSRRLGLKSEILDYRTSADASGDTSRVVGYMSAIIY